MLKLTPWFILPFFLITVLVASSPARPPSLAPASPPAPQNTPCTITFSDVPASSIFASYIYDLACRGVVGGIGGGQFGPSGQANRAQFAKMASLGFAVPLVEPVLGNFNDLLPSNVLYRYIESAAATSVIRGYQQPAQCPSTVEPPCFQPNRTISRAEVAVIAMRAGGFGLVAAPASPTFSDVPATYFAYREIETAASLHIISGANGRFRPADPIRRDELCKVLSLAMQAAPPRPTPGGPPAASLGIYADGLAAGWDDYSWASTRNFASSVAHSGSHSLSISYDASYAGLYLHHEPISIGPYTTLRFYIQSGATDGQSISVHLVNAAANQSGSIRAVTDYIYPGHRITAGQWQAVVIPLRDLTNEGQISGIVLQSESQAALPVLYIDDLSLVSGNLSYYPTAAATPGPAPTAIPANLTYYRGVNLTGGEISWVGWPGTFGLNYTYPRAAEFDYFKSKGLNLIRLPFRWERLQPTLNGPLDGAALAHLDIAVGYARTRGMQVLLDPHNFARYRLGSSDYLIGSPQVPNAAYADFWRKLAQHYANEPNLYFGLMNEPHDTGGLWPAAAQAAVSAIREVDSSHTIFVPGECWTGAWTWQECNGSLSINDPQNKIVYEAHQYFDRDGSGNYAGSYDAEGATANTGVERVQPFIAWLQAHNAQGFLGEYGVPNDDPRWLEVTERMLTRLDQAGIGATYWAAGPWNGSSPVVIEPYPNGDDKPQLATIRRHLGRQQ